MAKGRSKELLDLRNEELYKRYKYLLEVKRLRYSAIFEILEREFYIAEGTIMHILRSRVYEEANPAPKEFSGFRPPKKRKGRSSDDSVELLFAE